MKKAKRQTIGTVSKEHTVVAKNHVPTNPAPRVPRISKLMALAIRFDLMLRDGTVANQTELAKVANVSQLRMTLILNFPVQPQR